MDDIRLMRRDITIQTVLNAVQSFAILGIIWFLVQKHRSDNDPKVLKVEANPVNSNINNVSVPDSLTIERERAARIGYYTKAQFAQLMGFSVRTLERRIACGCMSPPPTITESGEVRIDLDATLAAH